MPRQRAAAQERNNNGDGGLGHDTVTSVERMMASWAVEAPVAMLRVYARGRAYRR